MPRLEILRASAPGMFRRGFSLIASKRKLYVRTAGTKVPLGLQWEDASNDQVLRQALLLKEHLISHQGHYNAERWQGQLADQADLPGQPRREPTGTLDELEQYWWERKQAEGITRVTFERHYGRFIRQLDPRAPLSEASLIKVISSIASDSPTRKRLVAFLRELVQARGGEWNSVLLDPLQMRSQPAPQRCASPCCSPTLNGSATSAPPLAAPAAPRAGEQRHRQRQRRACGGHQMIHCRDIAAGILRAVQHQAQLQKAPADASFFPRNQITPLAAPWRSPEKMCRELETSNTP